MVIPYARKLNFDMNSTQLVLNSIGKIDQFKGKWSLLEGKQSKYLQELKYIATIESIGSSTRIEGSKLSNDEVKQLLDIISIQQFETRDQQEVVGYYEALETIIENYQSIPITENYIKQLHSILLKHSSKDTRHRGIYKALSNKVVATYPDGTEQIIFNTTEPHLVQFEMEKLTSWFNATLISRDIHPLIAIGLFIYEFLSIHPFQDGNGRLSRLLTTMLLLKCDYNFVEYISFEHIIEERKKDYYKALASCQCNRSTDKEIVTNWIVFFLDCIKILIEKLEIKYELFQAKGSYLNERQTQILDLFKIKEPIKISDITQAFPDVSRNTIKKDLIFLLNESLIFKMGKQKGTIYYLKK